jgi:ribosomal protein S18 acetylase RimI-like enzyme
MIMTESTTSEKEVNTHKNNMIIESLKPNEIKQAAFLMSKAFIQTPFSSKVAGGQSEKHRRMLEIGFKNMLEKKPGKKVVIKDNGEIVGIMRMVKWPDCQNSIPQGFEKIPTLIFGRSAALRLFKFRFIWKKHDPKKPHWHIDPLCVLPERQGEGIGSQLLTYFCNYIDEQNAAAYHETDQEQNVRLYEKFGYKVVETEPIFSITNWFLWRPPQKNK